MSLKSGAGCAHCYYRKIMCASGLLALRQLTWRMLQERSCLMSPAANGQMRCWRFQELKHLFFRSSLNRTKSQAVFPQKPRVSLGLCRARRLWLARAIRQPVQLAWALLNPARSMQSSGVQALSLPPQADLILTREGVCILFAMQFPIAGM